MITDANIGNFIYEHSELISKLSASIIVSNLDLDTNDFELMSKILGILSHSIKAIVTENLLQSDDSNYTKTRRKIEQHAKDKLQKIGVKINE